MSIEIIKYINKETNKEIKLPIDRKMIFVYGKNGSGKTTLSNSVKDSDVLVFNESFIYKNVYVIEEDGATVNQNNKNNFSELLIGENEVALKMKIKSHEGIKKEITNRINSINDKINEKLLKNELTNSDNILLQKVDNPFFYNYDLNIDDQLNAYVYESKLLKTIKNDDELENKVNQLKKHDVLVQLNKAIDNNHLLNAYLHRNESDIQTYNKRIEYIKTNEKSIIELENLARNKNISSVNLDVIRSCLKVQSQIDEDKCFLCGTPNVIDKINEWNKIIYNEIMEKRKKLIEEFSNSVKIAKSIIDMKDLYNPIAPNTISSISAFVDEIENIIKLINNNSYDFINSSTIELDCNLKEVSTLKEEIRDYILLPYEKELVFFNSLNKDNNKQINKYKNDLDKLLYKNSNENEESIKNILTELGLNKDISIGIDRLGGKIKYKIELKNGKINTLSDGQKHKLALAIFLNFIKNQDLENKIIIFDDPVVSLDELGYHLFKDYIVHNVMNEDINKSPTIIILTHNFNYLYVQISNILANKNLRDNSIVYKLSSTNLLPLNFHYFELDDIALFRECLSNIKYRFQLNDLSVIYLKVFRIFIDLSLRIKGIPDTLEIKDEIPKLNLSTQNESRLKHIHWELCSISKNPNSNFDKSKDGLVLLKEAIDILGFTYITDNDIRQIDSLDEKEPFYLNDIFFILNEIKDILFSPYNNGYYKYLCHPRISFTQNIIATSMDEQL